MCEIAYSSSCTWIYRTQLSGIPSLKIPTYILKSSNLYRFQPIVALKNQSQRPFDKRSQADRDEDSTVSSPAGEISSDGAGGALLSELGGIFTLKEGKRTAPLGPKRRFEWLCREFNIRLSGALRLATAAVTDPKCHPRHQWESSRCR